MPNKHTTRPRMWPMAERIALLVPALFLAALAMAIAALLTGCAAFPASITATADERAACQTSGCTVWTELELQELALHFFKQGQKSRGTGI